MICGHFKTFIFKVKIVTADQGVVGVCTPDNSRYPFIVT